MIKKRYILSMIYDFHPHGEMLNSIESFNSKEEYERLKVYENKEWDIFEVLDTESFKIYRSHNSLPNIEFEKEL